MWTGPFHLVGVWRRPVGVPGDGADERRRAAGQNLASEVFLWERSQRCAVHHHQDCGVPARAGGMFLWVSTQICSHRWPSMTSVFTERFKVLELNLSGGRYGNAASDKIMRCSYLLSPHLMICLINLIYINWWFNP